MMISLLSKVVHFSSQPTTRIMDSIATSIRFLRWVWLLASDHSRRLQTAEAPHLPASFMRSLSQKPNSILSLKEPPSEWPESGGQAARQPANGAGKSCIRPDNFEESIGARDRENAASM